MWVLEVVVVLVVVCVEGGCGVCCRCFRLNLCRHCRCSFILSVAGDGGFGDSTGSCGVVVVAMVVVEAVAVAVIVVVIWGGFALYAADIYGSRALIDVLIIGGLLFCC